MDAYEISELKAVPYPLGVHVLTVAGQCMHSIFKGYELFRDNIVQGKYCHLLYMYMYQMYIYDIV